MDTAEPVSKGSKRHLYSLRKGRDNPQSGAMFANLTSDKGLVFITKNSYDSRSCGSDGCHSPGGSVTPPILLPAAGPGMPPHPQLAPCSPTSRLDFSLF